MLHEENLLPQEKSIQDGLRSHYQWLPQSLETIGYKTMDSILEACKEIS
jgi:hypothetical protein